MMWLALTAGTIASPGFHKFVLVVDDACCPIIFEGAEKRDALRLVDQTFCALSRRTGMKMTVRGRSLCACFRIEMEKAFPRMLSAGAFEFELTALSLLDSRLD